MTHPHAHESTRPPGPSTTIRGPLKPILLLAAALSLSLTVTIGLVGCNPLALAYFLQPFEPRIPGEGPNLEKATVVVLVSAAPDLRYSFVDLESDLTNAYIRRLRDNVKKIRVIDPDRIRTWMNDQSTFTQTNPRALAEEFEAEYVIVLEVDHFETTNPSNPGLFFGQGDVRTTITRWGHPTDDRGKPDEDQPKETEQVFETFDSITYPRVQGPIQADNSTGPVFYQRFVQLLALELSWHLTGRGSGDDIQDTRGL